MSETTRDRGVPDQEACRAEAVPEHREVLRNLAALAAEQDGVVSRQQARKAGLSRQRLSTDVAGRRLRVLGRNAIVLPGSTVSARRTWRVALAHANRRAALDGVTALQAAGLTGWDDAVHLSIPRGAKARPMEGVVAHELRSFDEADVIDPGGGGLRRVRPPLAAARAAIWAQSDRAALTLLAMAAQQRLVRPEALLDAARRLPTRGRWRLVCCAVQDVIDGAHSLGELGFAAMCRQAGLPEPDRQVVARGPHGRIYLDVRWHVYSVVVEVDGVQHMAAQTVVREWLRHNELVIAGDRVLRIPLLGLRVAPDEFLGQVKDALLAAGWSPEDGFSLKGSSAGRLC